MKRIFCGAAILGLAGLVLMANSDRGLAQTFEPGPGSGGAVLKDPFAPAAPMPVPSSGSSVDALINPAPTNDPGNRPLQRHEEKPDFNRDIQVTKDQGPWMVMVQCYTSPEASIMARQMVMELRTAYKLPAYTFNYGAEERRKEYERLKSVIEKQKEYLARNGLPLDGPIRVRTMRIEEQVGVLIGAGYPNELAAKGALDGMRRLKLDPHKVMLDKKVVYQQEKNTDKSATAKINILKEEFVNPFEKAFVVHNPTSKVERPADWDKIDMGLLHKLNAGESFSLLTCKKPFTLAVKNFPTPTIVEQKTPAGSFLESLSLGGKSGQRVDAAATSAHNLAELLRKAKLDAYVLHTKYTSIVTVGGYDNLDDPSLRNMANLIESKVMPQISHLFPAPPNQAVADNKVVPMQIPR